MVKYRSSYENEEKQEKKKEKEQKKNNKEQWHDIQKSKLYLKELEELRDKGMIDIDEEMMKKIEEDSKLDTKEINTVVESVEFKKIVEKIEEMEKLLEQEDILPKELKIKKQEFIKACESTQEKDILLKKIDQTLDYVNNAVGTSWSKIGGNPLVRNIRMRENLLFLANKKIIEIQEHMIDIKNYLWDK